MAGTLRLARAGPVSTSLLSRPGALRRVSGRGLDYQIPYCPTSGALVLTTNDTGRVCHGL